VTLLLETLGVLALAAVAAAALGLARSIRPTWPVVAVVATVIAGWAFLAQVYTVGSLAVDVHEHFGEIAPVDRRALGGSGFTNGSEGFMRWIEERARPDERLYLECDREACAGGLNEWITYRLMPRRFTDRPEQADRVIFYGTNPRRLSYARGYERERFAPKYELGTAPR
jgi:hypothetical protein